MKLSYFNKTLSSQNILVYPSILTENRIGNTRAIIETKPYLYTLSKAHS